MLCAPRIAGWLGLASLFVLASSTHAQLAGLWEFNNAGNLGLATVGNNLEFFGVAPTHSASLADDAAFSLNGVITTAAAVNANRVRATHGIAPNGGSATLVNQYTIVTDVFSPVASRSAWRTIYQTNQANSNDADYFIRNTDDRLGVGELTYSTNPIDETVWTRLVITVDLTKLGNDVVTYLNGSHFHTHTPNLAIGSRFSLDPTMFFFTDENGDNAPLNVGVVAIYGNTLTPFEVAQLGGPGDPILSEFQKEVLGLTINRDNGTATITNSTLSTVTIKGYQILSAAGSLSEPDAVFLADTDPNWIQFTHSGAVTDLSEGHLTTGTPLGIGASINLSDGAWSKYYLENTDITFEYLDGAGVLQVGTVAFTGTTRTTPYLKGDLNFDGEVDELDWEEYVAHLGSSFTGLSASQAYRFGDLNSDGVNGHADFVEFKNLFDAANGTGAFNAMLAGNPVPEPASLALLAIGSALAFGGKRVRKFAFLAIGMVASLCMLTNQSSAAIPTPVGLWQFDNNLNESIGSGATLANRGGFTETYASATIAGGSATVLNVPAFPTAAQSLALTHLIPGDGGTAVVNDYTLVWDVLFEGPTPILFASLLNTNQNNANDVDVFIRGSNLGIDIGAATVGPGSFALDTWYRITMTAKGDQGAGTQTTTAYLNGLLLGSTAGNAFNGVMTLDPIVHVFGDESGETHPTKVNSFAVWDRPLTHLEVLALGGPTANGIDPNVLVPQLTITVNKTNGNITMVNESGIALPQSINYYEIVSGDGVGGDGLLTTVGWNSFANQSGVTPGINPVANPGSPTPGAGNDPGESWSEGGGSTADRLTEAFLLGSTPFANAFSVNLGNVYTGGAAGDENLAFNYALANGTLFPGIVKYVTSDDVPGDYNSDGVVNAADYTLFRDTLGSNSNLAADGNGNNTIDDGDYTVWRNNFGSDGSGSGLGSLAADVPEPTSLLLAASCVGFLFATFRRRRGGGIKMKYRLNVALWIGLWWVGSPALATVTTDRNYKLGDDSVEVASDGAEVGANFTDINGNRFTADSQNNGTDFFDAQDLQVFGAPRYRDVSSRPLHIGSGLGVEFDGVDDVLNGYPLNIPEESATIILNFPIVYAGIKTRGLQMWVRPDASALGTPGSPTARQGIVMDSVAMGGVSITANGYWTQVNDGRATDINPPPSSVAVVGDTWHHVMQHAYLATDPGAPRIVAGTGILLPVTSVVYVNGIAIAANNDNPIAGDLIAGGRVGGLVVGAEELPDPGEPAVFGNFFKGTIDNLQMYVSGDNSHVFGGQNFGSFDLFADNEWIANEIATTVPGGILHIGDVNKDGSVSGNGSGLANVDDVTAFVEGWLSQNVIKGASSSLFTVGDWHTWGSGDMNHDGRTDLRDWALINAANPSMGGAILATLSGNSVPEPSSFALAGMVLVALGAVVRRRLAN